MEEFFSGNVTSWLWDTMANARGDRATMKRLLTQMDRDELERFYSQFEWAVAELGNDDIRGVLGYSRDDIHELAAWMVSQGWDCCAKVRDQPDLFPKLDAIDPSEGFDGLAGEVYWERFGESIPNIG